METLTENQNEQPRTTKSICHSNFHSFAPILDYWNVADIKNHEKIQRARTDTEKQQRAIKSNESRNEHCGWKKTKQAIKNQNEQQRAKTFQMETRLFCPD